MFWSNSNKTKNNGNDPLIDMRQVVKKYNGVGGTVMALKGVDLQIYPGEFVAVMGKSGCGKTTLINMLTGLDHLTSGEIWIDGTPIHQLKPEQAAKWRGRNVGVVFQSFELLPTLSVLQNVTLPMDFANRYSLRKQRQRAMQLLEQVEIAEHAHKLPSAVSGGQQQRVAIARAIANEPQILVADEPTGSLDSVTTEAVIDVFAELAAQGTTVFLVTHDEDVAKRAGRIITLADGKIVSESRGAHNA